MVRGATQDHYFLDGLSLCGGWPLRGYEGKLSHPGRVTEWDCPLCRKRLARLRREGRIGSAAPRGASASY